MHKKKMPRRVLVDGAIRCGALLCCAPHTCCEAIDVEPVTDGTIFTTGKLIHEERWSKLAAPEHEHVRELDAAREAAVGVPEVLQMEKSDRPHCLLPRELLREAKRILFGWQVIVVLLEDVEHFLRRGPIVEAYEDELCFPVCFLDSEVRRFDELFRELGHFDEVDLSAQLNCGLAVAKLDSLCFELVEAWLPNIPMRTHYTSPVKNGTQKPG